MRPALAASYSQERDTPSWAATSEGFRRQRARGRRFWIHAATDLVGPRTANDVRRVQTGRCLADMRIARRDTARTQRPLDPASSLHSAPGRRIAAGVEAPDVQRAVSEFFSRGRLVLDTSALLPCFYETLSPENEQRYTNLLRGAQGAGIQLFVTEGVCNEINSHFNKAIICARRSHTWEGEVPLVYAEWLRLTGGGDFSAFARRFRGDGGEDEIQLFLEQSLGIEMIDLDSAVNSIDMAMRAEVTELWRPCKKVRMSSSEMERDILLRHDVEMYFGVLGLRRGEKRNMYGYEAWLVTEDHSGLNMFDLARKANLTLPSNPCLSPSFLANMLSIGPPRSTIDTNLRRQLPVALTLRRQGFGEAGLYSWADEIRAEFAHEPEWRIRQRIRQRMNELKMTRAKLGPATALELDDDDTSDLEVLTETVGTDDCELDIVQVPADT